MCVLSGRGVKMSCEVNCVCLFMWFCCCYLSVKEIVGRECFKFF